MGVTGGADRVLGTHRGLRCLAHAMHLAARWLSQTPPHTLRALHCASRVAIELTSGAQVGTGSVSVCNEMHDFSRMSKGGFFTNKK